MRGGLGLTKRTNYARAGVALILLAFALLLAPAAAPGGAGLDRAGAQEGGSETEPAIEPPELDVSSWALVDAETGRYLDGENPDEQLAMGSTAKIMSVLVALEDEELDLDQEVTVSPEAAEFATPPYSNAALYPYDQVSMGELIQASLIPSGIDAVYALAEEMGDGSVEQFVGRMNQRASSLGLENTFFDNPAGIDAPEQYSSARDLATMARAGLEYPLFAETVATTEVTISTQDRNIDLVNTNTLLTTYPPATGVKTGTSPEAGEVLVASAEAEDESFISVVMNADNRYPATEGLLEYGFARYESEPLVRQDEVYEEVAPPYRREESVELAATEDVTALTDANSEVEQRVTTQEELPPSAGAGEELGEVELLVDGQRVGQSPLVTVEGYEEASLWNWVTYAIGGLVESITGAVSGLFE